MIACSFEHVPWRWALNGRLAHGLGVAWAELGDCTKGAPHPLVSIRMPPVPWCVMVSTPSTSGAPLIEEAVELYEAGRWVLSPEQLAQLAKVAAGCGGRLRRQATATVSRAASPDV